MKRFYVSFFVFIFFLSFFTNQKTLFAESHYRGIKAAVGVAAMAGSLVLWRHLGKKIEKVEKLQKVFEKIRGVDHGYAERIKKLLLYKHLFLFAALLSCGYTIKQVAGILKEMAEARAEAEKLEDERDAANEVWPTCYGYHRFSCSNGDVSEFFWRSSGKKLFLGINREKGVPSRYDCSFIALENHGQAIRVDGLVHDRLKILNLGQDVARSESEVWNMFNTGFELELKKSHTKQ